MQHIDRYQRREGFPITRRGLCEVLGLAAPSSAQRLIECLEAAGVIERVADRNGILRVTLLGRSVLNSQTVAA